MILRFTVPKAAIYKSTLPFTFFVNGVGCRVASLGFMGPRSLISTLSSVSKKRLK
jgi:hypothetical protein